MAGPYIGVLSFTNGRQLSIYQAANVAVGTPLPVEVSGQASTSSDTFFMVPAGEVWTVLDFVTGNLSGQVQVYKENLPSGKFFSTDATRAATASNRPMIPLTFVPGVRYRLVESVQGAAKRGLTAPTFIR
jgi:hypothetical protein